MADRNAYRTLAAWMLGACALHAQVISEWAFGGPDHRLAYRFDERGDRLMDFSSAGYRGGGVAAPSLAIGQRLLPAAGDSTSRIQAALDTAEGAVVLAPGEYELAGTLHIRRGGVVLRGEKGAGIRLTGRPHGFLEIHGAGTWQEDGPAAPVLDSYVPAGASRFRVRDAARFHAGDPVLVLRQWSGKPTHFPGIDQPIVNLEPQVGTGAGGVIRTDRVVDSVDGDRVTLDVPLSDALDSQAAAVSLVRYRFPGRITEAGVEGLRIVAPFEDRAVAVLRMDAVEDGWARDLEIEEQENGVALGASAKRITLTNVRIAHTARHPGPAAPVDFALEGTQILLDRCRVTGEGTRPVATEAWTSGPLVALNFSADHGGVSGDPYWTTGLLVDGGKFPGATEATPGVAFSNHIGWAVAWNVSSPFLLVQEPPGATNWCIGCIGSPVTAGGAPNGVFDSTGKVVHPSSLYLQQLRDRVGPDAVRNIGYADSLGKLL